MNAPAPKTSPDAALGNLLGAALGTPDTGRPIGAQPAKPPSYGAPTEVAQRIEQYIGRYGREDTATLLLYEAMNALRHHAPAAGDAQELLGALIEARRELHACQAVIHYAGGFDPAYVHDAQAAIKRADAAIAAQQGQDGR